MRALEWVGQDVKEGFPRSPLYGETVGTAIVAYLLRHYSEQVRDGQEGEQQ
jgi:hypothetical protein